MAAATTNKFTDTFNAAVPNSARVTSTRTAGAASLSCDNLAGWPTVSKVHFVTYSIDTGNAKVAGSQIEWYGIVSGNNIGSMTRLAGASDSGNTIGQVVEMMPTASWGHDLYSGLTAEHNQDGTHSAVTATSLVTSGNVTVGGTLTIAGTTNDGYNPITGTVTAATYNGNRSYTLTTSADNTGLISNGMRLRTTRTVTAPTQCTSLNGTTQYYSKAAPAGMTFTDDFVAGAWVKLSSYPTYDAAIVSRFNGTSGFIAYVQANTGAIVMKGYNAGAANYRAVASYQSIPLNKWVHVAVQLDMSSYPTMSSTTNYIMLDGQDIPAFGSVGGTSPVALIQAGNLEIGSFNGGTQPLAGKIAQAFVTSAKLTQTQVRAIYSQGLTSADMATYSIISAYSFNNSITDINTTSANNLTANGSAVATNADSPFTQNASGTPTGTSDYAIVTGITSTTITCQVPEGCTIPTSGGVSAVSYSGIKAPYGFPAQRGKWRINTLQRTDTATTSNATYGSYNSGGFALNVPIGDWLVGWQSGGVYNTSTTPVWFNISASTSIVGLSNSAGHDLSPFSQRVTSPSAAALVINAKTEQPQSLAAATSYIMYSLGSTTGAGLAGNTSTTEIYAECAYL